jgi:hypothetical protein
MGRREQPVNTSANMKTVRLLIGMALLSSFNRATAPAQSPPGPSLTVRWEDAQHLTLLWPTSALDFVLEQRLDLSPGSRWSLCPQTALLVGDPCRVSLPATNASRFYRLHQFVPPDPGTVAPALDLTGVTDLGTATAFLYAGDEPIQTGVAPLHVHVVGAQAADVTARSSSLQRMGPTGSALALSHAVK